MSEEEKSKDGEKTIKSEAEILKEEELRVAKIKVGELLEESKKYQKRNNIILGVLFAVSFLGFIILLLYFPSISEEDKVHLYQFPRTGDALREMHAVVAKYTETHYSMVVFAFCYLYIFLQTFAIPGPIVLSLLSGALFGGVLGLSLVSVCATFGACMCNQLASIIGKNLVLRKLPNQIAWFHVRIQHHKHNLFYYVLFLRITPLLPNWFINVSSPILNVPFSYFFIATLFGLIPANIIHVRTSLFLRDVQRVGGLDWKDLVFLFGVGFIALIPTLFKKKLEKLKES